MKWEDYCTILLFIILVEPASSFFEYGNHKIGEAESLKYNGKIPGLRSNLKVNVNHNRTDLESSYTYLSVVTTGTIVISEPIITFDPKTNDLTFFIKYPLFRMSFYANGFSMPNKTLRSGSDSLNENKHGPWVPQKRSFNSIPLNICILCYQCCLSIGSARKHTIYIFRI